MTKANSEVSAIERALKEMEKEHEELFQAVDRIRAAISANNRDTATNHLLELQLHQQSHFEHEVRLMVQYDYPHIDEHRKTHENLIDTLHSINKLISIENLRRLNDELTDYLETSLRHIVEVDRPFQEFLVLCHEA